jgi:hypothetical protein
LVASLRQAGQDSRIDKAKPEGGKIWDLELYLIFSWLVPPRAAPLL